MVRVFTTVVFLVTVVFLHNSCSKEKLQAKTAFFLKVPEVSVYVPASAGTPTNSGSHKITDLWLYVNGKFQGAYQLGRQMPIVSESPARIDILAGINRNGFNDKKGDYQFYDRLTFELSGNKGETIEKKLVFTYKASTNIRFFESFEGFGTTSGISMKRSFNSDTTFSILSGNGAAFEGTRCLNIVVDNTRKLANIETINSNFALPLNSEYVYLEIDYKCNQAFDVGVYKNGSYIIAGGVNASSDWNKIYIQLSTAVSSLPINPNDQTCGLYFRVIKSSDVLQGEVQLDNVKIVTY